MATRYLLLPVIEWPAAKYISKALVGVIREHRQAHMLRRSVDEDVARRVENPAFDVRGKGDLDVAGDDSLKVIQNLDDVLRVDLEPGDSALHDVGPLFEFVELFLQRLELGEPLRGRDGRGPQSPRLIAHNERSDNDKEQQQRDEPRGRRDGAALPDQKCERCEQREADGRQRLGNHVDCCASQHIVTEARDRVLGLHGERVFVRHGVRTPAFVPPRVLRRDATESLAALSE